MDGELCLHRCALGGRGEDGISSNGRDVEFATFRAVVRVSRMCPMAIDTEGRVVTNSRIRAVFLAAGRALGSVCIFRVLITTDATSDRGATVSDKVSQTPAARALT